MLFGRYPAFFFFFTVLPVFLLLLPSFLNACPVGHGSESSGADEHPEQNHREA